MPVGLPTSKSHGPPMYNLLEELNSIFVNAKKTAEQYRTQMSAGNVTDEIIRDVWLHFAAAERRLGEMRSAPELNNNYARHRGLSYYFNCTNDVDGTLDQVKGLPNNHKFKSNYAVKFVLNDGSLPTGLVESTTYYIRTVDGSTLTFSTTEGGGSDIDLTAQAGTAELLVNVKPDSITFLQAIDAALDEIELNLTQRAPAYDRENVQLTYSTYSSVETATLQAKLQDIENIVDTTPA